MSVSDKCLAIMYGPPCRPGTQRTMTSLFNHWIRHQYQTWEPDGDGEITMLLAIQDWQAAKLSPQTQKMLVNLLGRFLSFQGRPVMSTTRYVKKVMGAKQKPKINALNKLQAHKLLAACKAMDQELYEVVFVAYHTGMRRGEVFGLEWDDVTILKSQIEVQRSYDGPTKNGLSRIIPMSSDLEAFFLDKTVQNSHNYIGKKVFTKKFDPNPGLQAACRRARVPIITFHGLRHTFATLALEAGRSPKQVQEVLGHSKLSTTLDLYWASTQGAMEMGFC